MNAIIVGLVGAILSLGGLFGYSQYQQSFGALPLIQSAQLAASPANGECLSTNGTVNDWTTCGVGGGLTTYDAWTHPASGISATTSRMIFNSASSTFTGGLNISTTTIKNATTTSLSVSNTASTTSLIVSGLNATSCDVKASTAGVLSCGTDATGAGGAAFGQVFELINASTIAATTTNKNLVVGSASLPASEACTLCVFATDTGTDYLIFASTTPGYGGDLLSFVNSTGGSLLYVNSTGALTAAAGGEFGANLSVLGSTITLGSTGVSLTHDADGALTFTSLGDTNTEALTVNLDDTANTAVWSSSTGVNNIDWSLITKSTFTNASTSLFSTTYGSTTDAIIGRTLTLFGTAYTTLAGLGNALVNAVTAVTPTGTWDFGGATSVEMVNGASPTVDAVGEFALDTTANQVLIATSTNAGGAGVIPLYKTFGFQYATTSWTGTTTIYLGPADAAQDWKTAKCETTTGTLNVSVYDGTNRMDLLNASTTIGTFNFATNNNFTSSESRRVDIGTPASSPVRIACTFTYTYVRQ